MRNGILIVNKPVGLTSHDVVDRVRRRFGYRRVGHAGTLDPSAEGVLVLGLGREATRLLGRYSECDKEYRAVMVLGAATDSQDGDGRIIERKDTNGITEAAIREAIARFTGDQQQVPPMFSALKREGKPLYRLARRGTVVPRATRPVRIHELELCGYDPPEVSLRVACSKGTYVRTLCADIGAALGCGAHLKKLVRTRVGKFMLRDALLLDEVLRMSPEEMENKIILVES
jgi:tRNA pseudouridine55 synthase